MLISSARSKRLSVAMQQLCTTIGIFLAHWIAYGTNNMGGTGESQSDMAWRLPLIIQGIPAVILCLGVWCKPTRIHGMQSGEH